MLARKQKKPLPEKTTYFFDEKEGIIVKIVSNTPTMFPEKLAAANEIIKKAKFMTPEQLQEVARIQSIYRARQLNERKEHE